MCAGCWGGVRDLGEAQAPGIAAFGDFDGNGVEELALGAAPLSIADWHGFCPKGDRWFIDLDKAAKARAWDRPWRAGAWWREARRICKSRERAPSSSAGRRRRSNASPSGTTPRPGLGRQLRALHHGFRRDRGLAMTVRTFEQSSAGRRSWKALLKLNEQARMSEWVSLLANWFSVCSEIVNRPRSQRFAAPEPGDKPQVNISE